MTKIAATACRTLRVGLFFVSVYMGSTAIGVESKLKESPPTVLEFIRKIPHSGYSEGIDFHDGFLWSANPKIIKKIDPKDGSVIESFPPATEYSESLTWMDGALWNVSFTDNSIHSGKKGARGMQFKKRGTVPEVHAWGLCHDGKHLIFTGDYSSKLYFMDPKSIKIIRTLVTDGKDLEDLAWDGTWIWSSSFTAHPGEIFRIDPKSGKINAYYSIPEKEQCPIVDGLAYDGKGLWITGKECPSIWYVKLPR